MTLGEGPQALHGRVPATHAGGTPARRARKPRRRDGSGAIADPVRPGAPASAPSSSRRAVGLLRPLSATIALRAIPFSASRADDREQPQCAVDALGSRKLADGGKVPCMIVPKAVQIVDRYNRRHCSGSCDMRHIAMDRRACILRTRPRLKNVYNVDLHHSCFGRSGAMGREHAWRHRRLSVARHGRCGAGGMFVPPPKLSG